MPDRDTPVLPLDDLPTPQRMGTLTLAGNPPVRWVALGSGTTLICCNGAMTTSMFWARTAQALAGRHQVVLWDYPGHGASGLGDEVGDLSMPTLARYLDRIRAELGASQTVLLGHSMGCQVALEACRLFPERVSGLVLVTPTAGRLRDWRMYGVPMPAVLTAVAVAARLGSGGDVSLLERVLRSPAVCGALVRAQLVHPRLIDPRHIDAHVAHIAALSPEVISRLLAHASHHDVLDFVGSLRSPCLVVAGDRDPVLPYAFTERLAAVMPNARVRPVLGATHALPIEFPAFLTRYIEDFLGELSAGSPRASPTPAQRPTEPLVLLLMDLFSHEELVFWARVGPAGDEILQHIPLGCSYATLTAALVDAHRARGLLNQEFFERLMRVRPRREADIYRVARGFGYGS